MDTDITTTEDSSLLCAPVNDDIEVLSQNVSKEGRVINWFATCGKEDGRQYPGWTLRGCMGEGYWEEQSPNTRGMVDKLQRPYAIGYYDGGDLDDLDDLDDYALEECLSIRDPYRVPSRYIIPHKSEMGWNLPVDHSRHIFKLPDEILLRILEHCVVAPGMVTPKCVFCNLDSEKLLPTYTTTGGNDLWRTLTRRVRDDDTGDCFIETVNIWQRPIDATVLRVCKWFKIEGQKLLYGKNTFEFNLTRDYRMDPEMGLGGMDADYKCYYKSRMMPEKSELHTPLIQKDIRQLMDEGEGADWTFTDPFLRFLKTIGPKNASLIRNLEFCGPVFFTGFPGRTNQQFCHPLGERFNLLYYLEAYTIFIELYCPNLEYLGLGIVRFGDCYERAPNALAASLAATEESLLAKELPVRTAFKNLLDGVVTRMKSLVKLEVRSYRQEGYPLFRHVSGAFGRKFYELILPTDHTVDEEDIAKDAKAFVAAALRERKKHSGTQTTAELDVSNEKEAVIQRGFWGF